jgi:hypothetical protein
VTLLLLFMFLEVMVMENEERLKVSHVVFVFQYVQILLSFNKHEMLSS